jgi:hypothetical protein
MRTIAPKSGTGTNRWKRVGSVAMVSNPAARLTLSGPVTTQAAIRDGAQPNGVGL